MLCTTCVGFCQADSIIKKNYKDSFLKKSDTSLIKKDSIHKVQNTDSTVFSLLQQYPIINSNAHSSTILTKYNNFENKTILFYVLVGCFLLLAITKQFFPKYFQSIFSIFFQTNFRQKQTKEQLLQDNIASLFTNIVFFLAIACLASLIIPQLINNTKIALWQIFIGSLITFICIYIVKFIFIQFIGWVFNNKEASNAYIFIVFIINKIIGILLLPFCLILAFADKHIVTIAEVIAIVIISILLLYRLLLTYRSTNTRLKINILHFFLYFCSLEILPLLIVFKVLQRFL